MKYNDSVMPPLASRAHRCTTSSPACVQHNDAVRIDVFETECMPHGLVRFGVAPDHPEVKNVASTFNAVLSSPRVRFFGHVAVGTPRPTQPTLPLDTLRACYAGTVLAYGAAASRALGVPGEQLAGVVPARDFVGWYNGLPACAALAPDLSSATAGAAVPAMHAPLTGAVIVGQGNVALDVARVLLSPVDVLARTDMCRHALDALAQSRVRRVVLVGRRGPLEVRCNACISRCHGCRWPSRSRSCGSWCGSRAWPQCLIRATLPSRRCIVRPRGIHVMRAGGDAVCRRHAPAEAPDRADAGHGTGHPCYDASFNHHDRRRRRSLRRARGSSCSSTGPHASLLSTMCVNAAASFTHRCSAQPPLS